MLHSVSEIRPYRFTIIGTITTGINITEINTIGIVVVAIVLVGVIWYILR